MGGYLMLNRVLVTPAPVPTRITEETEILLVHPAATPDYDPWAIGTGGDAAAPNSPEVIPLPARDCEMTFDATAGEAAICIFNIDTYDVLSISYSAGLFGSGTAPGLSAKSTGDVLTIEVATELSGPLSLRFKAKQVDLLDADREVIAGFTPDELGLTDWNAFVPVAFSATNNFEGEGNSRHCSGMDAIIDIMYDGVLDEGASQFWTSFYQTYEEA